MDGRGGYKGGRCGEGRGEDGCGEGEVGKGKEDGWGGEDKRNEVGGSIGVAPSKYHCGIVNSSLYSHYH